MKNECQATQLLLERYLDRELTEQESAAVESHLNRCPDCQNQLSIYQKTGALLKTSLGRSVDGISLERLWPRIEQAIRNRPQPAVTGRIFSSRYLAPVLVSALGATAPVVPVPKNGSRITSPGFDEAMSIRYSNASGFCVECAFVPFDLIRCFPVTKGKFQSERICRSSFKAFMDW